MSAEGSKHLNIHLSLSLSLSLSLYIYIYIYYWGEWFGGETTRVGGETTRGNDREGGGGVRRRLGAKRLVTFSKGLIIDFSKVPSFAG